MTLDSSGLIMTRPDSFNPNYDVLVTDKDYEIHMDVPGLRLEDITITRNNVITIINGERTLPYSEGLGSQRKRKFGKFSQKFEIPPEFERKFYSCEVVAGVLTLKYRRDMDDCPTDIVNDT
jgi:HSP20 family molecular chaperone IbpA